MVSIRRLQLRVMFVNTLHLLVHHMEGREVSHLKVTMERKSIHPTERGMEEVTGNIQVLVA